MVEPRSIVLAVLALVAALVGCTDSAERPQKQLSAQPSSVASSDPSGDPVSPPEPSRSPDNFDIGIITPPPENTPPARPPSDCPSGYDVCIPKLSQR